MFSQFKMSPATFLRNRSGNFAVTFALIAPVLLVGVVAAVDYSNTVGLRQRVQAAADSAALAAATAMANATVNGAPLTATQAQAIASQYFAANAPASAISAETSFTATPTASATGVSVAVSYTGSPVTLIGGYLNPGSMNLNIAATANAALTSTALSGAGQYAGNGMVYGDPHVMGADGSDNYLSCASPSGSWYNLISDSQFEINVNCVVNQAFNLDALQNVETLIGTHTVSITTVNAQVSGATQTVVNGDTYASWTGIVYPPGSWVGDVTIDGVLYPATPGTNTYLSDATQGVTVTVTVGDPGSPSDSNNYVTITTPVYSVTESYFNVGMGSVSIAATGAGKCGVPGGIWGGTLAGVDDSNGQDFLVSGPTYHAPQFAWGSCQTVTATSHLTQ